MQKEQLRLTESGCFGYSYLKIESKKTFLFWIYGKIINLSFNGLVYNMREHFAHCEWILTDGIRMFLNTLTKKIEANFQIAIFFVVE